MTVWEWGFFGGSVAIMIFDHLRSNARMQIKRARAIAERKLGNRFATSECLMGRHADCHKGCGECGYPCSCGCHGKI